MKRRREPVFDQLAASVISSRKLCNSGRKRITPAAWDAFLAFLPSASIGKATDAPGMPSMGAVYKRRKSDPEFRGLLDEILHSALREKERRVARSLRLAAIRAPAVVRAAANKSARPARSKGVGRKKSAAHGATSSNLPRIVGETLNTSLMRDPLYAAAASVVSIRMSPVARADIIADLVLAVLAGEIRVDDMTAQAKEYARRHWKMFGTFDVKSLDAPIRAGGSLTIGDTLSNESPSIWL